MQPSPLIRYALAGLGRCYMPERGLWSFRHHLDGRRADVNEARPDLDVFYSLNVLLGFSKLPETCWTDAGLDPRAMLPDVATRLLDTQAPHYAYGMALWAAAELSVPVPEAVLERILSITTIPGALRGWRAQDLGLLVSGAVAQSRTDPAWTRLARSALDIILDKLMCRSGLFRDRAAGPRRWFGTFATQVYCCLALYQYGERFGDTMAEQAADRCIERLMALQGPQGEWPWFFDAAGGRVLDFYEVYSVHQHGMAPAILRHAMRRGLPGAREALAKGFGWILGHNVLSQSMLRPELSMIARSQARRGFAGARTVRIARTAIGRALAKPPALDLGRQTLVITPEMRSYELGWTLWSFGDDTAFTDLTHDPAFAAVELPARVTVPAVAEQARAARWSDAPPRYPIPALD